MGRYWLESVWGDGGRETNIYITKRKKIKTNKMNFELIVCECIYVYRHV